jgi:hypothetical protein
LAQTEFCFQLITRAALLDLTNGRYEDIEEAQEWWDSVTVSPADKAKMGRTNAIRLFKLPLKLEVEENEKPYFKGEGTGPVDKWEI